MLEHFALSVLGVPLLKRQITHSVTKTKEWEAFKILAAMDCFNIISTRGVFHRKIANALASIFFFPNLLPTGVLVRRNMVIYSQFISYYVWSGNRLA